MVVILYIFIIFLRDFFIEICYIILVAFTFIYGNDHNSGKHFRNWRNLII